MKISHRQLDFAISNPSQWLQERVSSSSSFHGLGYDAVVRYGIFRYHKTNDPQAAADHVSGMLDRNAHRLKNQSRIQNVSARLEEYIAWAEAADLVVIETGALINFPSGNGLYLRGRISRVDVLDDGYRGVLLGTVSADWDKTIRMPLIQEAIARLYAVPVSDTYVAVQNLDGSQLRTRRFPADERAEAIRRFRGLAAKLGLQ